MKPGHSATTDGRRTLDFVSVDSFVATNAIEHVHVLKVDCEGYDPHVLAGSKDTLARGAADIVIFEYALWWLLANNPSKTSLCSTTAWLSGLGYDVFLMGRRNLLQLNGGCWADVYESWHYTNIVAIRRDYTYTQKLVNAYNLDFVYERGTN